MTHTLYLGDYAYSSWSLRAWLLFHRFDIDVQVRLVDFTRAPVADQLTDLAPARTVPTLVTPEGALIWESLAIAEEVATRHPGAGLWPSDPAARATARTLAAEMHAGFHALRGDCPMNLRCAYSSYTPPAGVLADLDRIEATWTHARKRHGGTDPWLCGGYSIADAFFAPVAMRIAGYGLPVGPEAQAYVAAHLNDPALRRWRAMSLVHGADLARYARDYDQVAWPGPAPLPAQAVAQGPSENDTCPYSGDPVRYFLRIQDRVFGFGTRFCRDKTAADPAAWPDVMALL